jgi:Peptidase inhibitor family I36
MVRKGALVAGTAALAIAGGVVAAAPANASVWDCPASRVCNWDGGGYEGGPWATGGTYNSYPSWINDRTSSIANRKSGAATFYGNAGYWGASWTLSSGSNAQLGWGYFNDVASSHIA